MLYDSLVWITNPITMPILFLMAYKVGAYFLNIEINNISFELTS